MDARKLAEVEVDLNGSDQREEKEMRKVGRGSNGWGFVLGILIDGIENCEKRFTRIRDVAVLVAIYFQNFKIMNS